MANSIQCRLAFLVTPKQELIKELGFQKFGDHEICRPTSVVTPERDYEDAFEGWKSAWKNKAKKDFLSKFKVTWSEDFPQFVAKLAETKCFDQWWSISEIDVIEINSARTPRETIEARRHT
jgi:hypothetical protein